MANILIDSSSSRIVATDWAVFPTDQTVGGSVSRSNSNSATTAFSITFNGTSISLFVITSLLAGSDVPSSSTVNIDNEQSWEVPIDRGDNATLLVEQQWFSTPVLNDTTHTVSVTNFPRNFSLDYALVTTGGQTPLDGEILIVNDNDPLIVYSGFWLSDTSSLLISVPGPVSLLDFVPVGGTTVKVEDSILYYAAQLNFTVYVYGILDGSQTGGDALFVTFNLDGVDSFRVYQPGAQIQTNFLWFSNDSSSSGGHTLRITPTNIGRIPFVLDYILYTASPHVIGGGAPSVNGPFSPPGSSSQSAGAPIPEILVGVVVGMLVLTAILLLSEFLYRKWIFGWRRSNSSKTSVSKKQNSQPSSSEATPSAPTTFLGLVFESISDVQGSDEGRILSPVRGWTEPNAAAISLEAELSRSPRPASVFLPPYHQTEDEKDERIRSHPASSAAGASPEASDMHFSNIIFVASLAISCLPGSIADIAALRADLVIVAAKVTDFNNEMNQFDRSPCEREALAVNNALTRLANAFPAATADTKASNPFTDIEGHTILSDITAFATIFIETINDLKDKHALVSQALGPLTFLIRNSLLSVQRTTKALEAVLDTHAPASLLEQAKALQAQGQAAIQNAIDAYND
ncbi:hypothetical protein DXG01_014168 [Tephrocybe rancida]|nr:hypothetical protein DXG01_014168 [Tephrocybe rancida]